MSKKKILIDDLLIVLMGILLAFNYRLFIIPNDFAPAGINGIAVMVQYKLGFSIGYMSLLINIPLCVFAFFTVQKRFAVRTLLLSAVYSLSYLILQNISWLDRFVYDANGIDTVYPVIIAGLLSGVCYSVLLKCSACSGGTDVIAKFVAKRRPYLNFFWITFGMNAVVALASFFVYAKEEGGVMQYDLKPACLCILYCFVSSYVGSLVVRESKSACNFIVITNHPEEIEKEIIEVMHHSATRLEGTGIYSGSGKTILLCVVNKHQMQDFESIIAKYPDTFTIEQSVIATVGNFKKIK